MYQSTTYFLLGLIAGSLFSAIFLYRIFKRNLESREDNINDTLVFDVEFEKEKVVNTPTESKNDIDEYTENILSKFTQYEGMLSHFNFFINEIEKEEPELLNNEQYLELSKLKKLKENRGDWFNLRKRWFLSNKGKFVYLMSDCNCDMCNDMSKKGIHVIDNKVALSLFGLENLYKIKGHSKTFYTKD